MRGIIQAGFFLLATAAAAQSPGMLNARDAGILGDGKTLETAAIQKAIDGLSASGGGTLYFPPGAYLTGTLRLRDNATLHLEAGAVILGSDDLADYPPVTVPFPTMNDAFYRHALIYAEDARNIAITGRGRIDGQGGAEGLRRKSTKAPERYMNRPSVIRFVNCAGVLLRDARIQNAGFWVTHLLACDDVVVDGVRVESRTANYNNDGIDVDCCSNVRISNCFIDSQDDALCLKSTGDRVCRNVTVTNCVFTSSCSGIRFGCEAVGGFEDITISNCVIYDTRATAIQLQVFDGGVMDRVVISGVTMRNVGQAILVNLGHEMYHIGIDEAELPVRRGAEPGAVRNIILRDILAEGVGRYRGASVGGEVTEMERRHGCIISGMPGHPIENLTLENIRMRFAGKGTAEDAANDLSQVKNGFNGDSMGVTPSYGFYCRNVRNLRMRDVETGYENEDVRPAVMVELAEKVDISGLGGMVHPSARGLLVLKNTRDALIQAAPSGVDNYLHAEDGVTGLRVEGQAR